jgi:Sec7-like guanine-nucleotide exchange factor
MPSTKRESHKQSAYTYETKENKADWGHRNISIKKEDKEKQHERRSIDKKNESAEKNWRMSANAKSAKMISGINERLIQEKTKEERRKAIQSKFDYRR